MNSNIPADVPAWVIGSSSPLAYSIKDAAAALGIGRTTLYALIKCGEIAPIKIGTRTLVPHVALEQFLERRREAA